MSPKATLERWLMPDPEFDEVGSVSWLLSCAFSMLALQAGFAMLESGLMPMRSNVNINLQNLVGAAIVGVFFFFTGWAFAFGDDHNGFIGGSQFALYKVKNIHLYRFFFHWVFAATSITVTSGAVAGRMKFPAYMAYVAFIAGFVYSVPAHWTFTDDGWLRKKGYYDFAGCGPIHLTGAMTGLAGSLVLGPRNGVFLEKGRTLSSYSNPSHALFGMLIIVCGWLAFNAGATLSLKAAEGLAAKAMVNTGISAGFGGVAGVILSFILNKMKHVDFVETSLGAMGSMVSIAAACSDVDPWYAAVIGLVGGIICPLFSKLLKRWQVDDPVYVASVHGASAFWGLISVAFFIKGDIHQYKGFVYHGSIDLLGHQLMGALCIMLWSFTTSFAFLHALKKIMSVRVSAEAERIGLDASEHGLVSLAIRETKDKAEDIAKAVEPLGMSIRQTGELVYVTLTDVSLVRKLQQSPSKDGGSRSTEKGREASLSPRKVSMSQQADCLTPPKRLLDPSRCNANVIRSRNSSNAWATTTEGAVPGHAITTLSPTDPLLLEAVRRISTVVPPKDVELLADDGCRKSMHFTALPDGMEPNEIPIAVIRKSTVKEDDGGRQGMEGDAELEKHQIQAGCVVS